MRAIQISCATSTGTPFLFIGPRHGFSSGWETLIDGLAIYTAALSQVDVDVGSSTMTVGGAAVMKDVSDALQTAGKNFRTCPPSPKKLFWPPCYLADNRALCIKKRWQADPVSA